MLTGACEAPGWRAGPQGCISSLGSAVGAAVASPLHLQLSLSPLVFHHKAHWVSTAVGFWGFAVTRATC